LVQFLLVHDRREVFALASLQSEVGRATVRQSAGDPNDLDTIYLVANYRAADARVLTKSRAVLFIARELGWPWKALGLLTILPTSMRDWGYDVMARSRYRLFGRLDTCFVPDPQSKRRFID
jgi:predicted DCC family thiol-disulfide oxidoreductase YuxK